MLAAILTVDLEEWYHANYGSLRSPPPRSPSRVVDHTQKLLELFEASGHRATFFTLGSVAREHPSLLREIVAAGHEVACHGDDHQQVSGLDRESFRADLRRARESIHNACGVAVEGYRAPSWSISPASWPPPDGEDWPLEVLADEGFTYDASLFPWRTYLYGVRDAPTTPHRLVLRDGRSLAELPASVVSFVGRKWPFGGGFFFRVLPLGLTSVLARRFHRQTETPFMFYLHPREISTHQPRLRLSLRDRLIHSVNLGSNRAKVERALGGFHFQNIASFLAQHRSDLPELSCR